MGTDQIGCGADESLPIAIVCAAQLQPSPPSEETISIILAHQITTSLPTHQSGSHLAHYGRQLGCVLRQAACMTIQIDSVFTILFVII